jgi:deazaflavin-dependent oxidoreductase (nitroreductase family)
MNALIKLFTRGHVFVYRASGGKRATRINGQDVILLTTTGRKSGKPRTVPVMSFDDQGDKLVVASKGGSPEHPAWFTNLTAHSEITVQAGPDEYKARAIVVDAEERDRLWQRIVREAPQFGGYEKKTTRVIPIVRLRRLQ